MSDDGTVMNAVEEVSHKRRNPDPEPAEQPGLPEVGQLEPAPAGEPEAAGPSDGTTPEPGPDAPPILIKERTMLKETFQRLWRVGKSMAPEGISLMMVCPTCQTPVGIGMEGAKIVELLCRCTHWVIRDIFV